MKDRELVGVKLKEPYRSMIAQGSFFLHRGSDRSSDLYRMVELAGIEPACRDLASEASPGASGELLSESVRAPARSRAPILCECPTRYSGTCA